MTPTHPKWRFLPVFLLIAGFAGLCMAQQYGFLESVNWSVYHFATRLVDLPGWLLFWQGVSFLGSTGFVVLTGVPLWIATSVSFRMRGFLLGAAVAAAFFLPTALKPLFAVTRPLSLVPGLASHSFSFPSGHAFSAILIFALFPRVLIQVLRHGNRENTWLATFKHPGFFMSVAGLIAASRVFLGMHWPSDVVAGILLGGAVAALFTGLMTWDLRTHR